jgi:hypothetical protein
MYLDFDPRPESPAIAPSRSGKIAPEDQAIRPFDRSMNRDLKIKSG